jgi:hypothetical protein
VGGTCGTHGGGKRCLQGFGWRLEGTRPLGRPRRRWEDNIKMDLRVDRDRWGKLDSAGSGQGPMAGLCEHGNEPSGSIRKQDIS